MCLAWSQLLPNPKLQQIPLQSGVECSEGVRAQQASKDRSTGGLWGNAKEH